MITIEFIVIILCLLTGTRFGGMGLGADKRYRPVYFKFCLWSATR